MTSSCMAVERGVEMLLFDASQISKLFRWLLPIFLRNTLLTTFVSNLEESLKVKIFYIYSETSFEIYFD